MRGFHFSLNFPNEVSTFEKAYFNKVALRDSEVAVSKEFRVLWFMIEGKCKCHKEKKGLMTRSVLSSLASLLLCHLCNILSGFWHFRIGIIVPRILWKNVGQGRGCLGGEKCCNKITY